MYKYDYRNGRVTLNWLAPPGVAGWMYRFMCRIGLHWAVGLVRVHDNEDDIPGSYNCIVVAFVVGKKCEIVGLCGENPTGEEYRDFYKYLYSTGIGQIRLRRKKKGREMYEVSKARCANVS